MKGNDSFRGCQAAIIGETAQSGTYSDALVEGNKMSRCHFASLAIVIAVIAGGADNAVAELQPGASRDAVDQFGDPLPDGVLLRLGTVRLRNGQGVEGVAF